jgi:hypothetical protein
MIINLRHNLLMSFFLLQIAAANIKKINIPTKIDYDLAKVFGYYLGDGNYELDRITFSEQRKEVAEYYKNLIKEIFEIDSNLKFREDKNYWQLRVYSRIIAQLFKKIFSNKDKTLKFIQDIATASLNLTKEACKENNGTYYNLSKSQEIALVDKAKTNDAALSGGRSRRLKRRRGRKSRRSRR